MIHAKPYSPPSCFLRPDRLHLHFDPSPVKPSLAETVLHSELIFVVFRCFYVILLPSFRFLLGLQKTNRRTIHYVLVGCTPILETYSFMLYSTFLFISIQAFPTSRATTRLPTVHTFVTRTTSHHDAAAVVARRCVGLRLEDLLLRPRHRIVRFNGRHRAM